MINLQKISGLPISLDEQKFELVFEGDFPFIKKSERSLKELRPYLKNPESAKGPDPAYYVWRHVHLKQDDKKIKASGLRYDLTLLPAGKIDGEFVKTAGHYHKNEAVPGLSYPEVYEVISGRAYFFFQAPGNDPKNLKSATLIEAGAGEKVIIPPDFSGHNTINVFDKPLLLANWISEKAVYDYEVHKNNNGAAYHFLANGESVDIIKNPKYGPVPEIKKIHAKEYPQLGILKTNPLYGLVSNLEKLRFLNYPEEFIHEWN